VAHQVEIWTDGSCAKVGTPIGFYAILCSGERRKDISGGYAQGTSPRAELWAVTVALEALRSPSTVTLTTDCEYIVKAWHESWYVRWLAQQWQGVANADLWLRIMEAAANHDITWKHIPGHSGDPMNDACDAGAKAARLVPDLPPDPGYMPKPPKPLTSSQRWILDELQGGGALMVPKLIPALPAHAQLGHFVRRVDGRRAYLNGSTANWLLNRKFVAFNGVEDALCMEYTISEKGRERRAADDAFS
jgi:ribonuclease HI